MKVLLSGTSSFTGYWIGKHLAEAGHQVTGIFQRESAQAYESQRGLRAHRFEEFGEAVFSCSFGSKRFLDQISGHNWDLYCHHASDVTNYRSPSFDPIGAVQRNCQGLAASLDALGQTGCRHLIWTGTVFEGGEGAGSDGLPHFSRYGLSKALSWQVFHFEARERGIKLGKFVIPNPFGPLEEPRFTSYLVDCWAQGKTPSVRTPDFIRDNIHVSLLARDYVDFAESFVLFKGPLQRNPSGLVSSMGVFAHIFAQEMNQRLPWDCQVELLTQTIFEEPMVRINTEPAAQRHNEWDECKAWDSLAEYYLQKLSAANPS